MCHHVKDLSGLTVEEISKHITIICSWLKNMPNKCGLKLHQKAGYLSIRIKGRISDCIGGTELNWPVGGKPPKSGTYIKSHTMLKRHKLDQ